VEKLSNSTKEINRLLDGLLSFCKVGSHNLNPQNVDVNEIVKGSIETLEPRMIRRKIEIRVDTLDPALADPVLLKQVFVNLLSNAITFTSTKDVALIEIGQIKGSESEEPVFYVKDNGVGFDPADEAKLFDAFRRLHADDHYEGTGVGLSIVAAIVQRHGGRIWATGIPNTGATFYFTLGGGGQNHQRIA
jgi:signal transduction histidine kinase